MWPRILGWGIIVTGFLWLSTLGHAATLQIDGTGRLTGATGVDVGGTLYDVVFLDGTCAGLFSGCDAPADFPFPTEAGALSAAQALLDQVFIGPFDTPPFPTGNIFGCPNDGFCGALIPFGFGEFNQLLTAVAINDVVESSDGLSIFEGTPTDTGSDSLFVYAVWTPSSSAAVPAPSTFVLLGAAGLAAWLARRKR